MACCGNRKRRLANPQQEAKPPMKWAYGITTTPERFHTTLPGTLQSLDAAGFPHPHLFIDCKSEVNVPAHLRAYDITVREENIGIVGNWILAMWELLIRLPDAHRYALFQDDLVMCKNTREYLEEIPYPKDGYLNLYMFPENEKIAQGRIGIHKASQRGKGAVVLIFDRPNAAAIVTSQHMVDKVACPKRGKKSLDGGVVSAANRDNRFEYIHYPSLIQHTGSESSMGNKKHPLAKSFRGEHFDALELLQKPKETPVLPPEPVIEKPLTKERKMRLGIMGPCCESPEGKVLQEIATRHVGTTWLVLPHPDLPTSPIPPGTGVYAGRTLNDFRKFLNGLDKLVYMGDPRPLVMQAAQSTNTKVVKLILGDHTGSGTPPDPEFNKWDQLPWDQLADETIVLAPGDAIPPVEDL